MLLAEEFRFWTGKRVFLTSPTSFLGSWIALSLRHLGATVIGFGEENFLRPNFFEISGLASSLAMTYGDLRDEKSLRDALDFASADVVIHLGEGGRLHEEDRNVVELISKSVLGTTTLLDVLRDTASVRSIVVVSSDKVYRRSSENKPFSESDPVEGQGLLPTARLCAEMVALVYRKSIFTPEKYNKHKIALATARVESAIGGGDLEERSFIAQTVRRHLGMGQVEIRHPHSLRAWIHVLDQVAGILSLAQALYVKGPKLSPTYNLGSSAQATVGDIFNELAAMAGQAPANLGAGNFSRHGSLNSDLALAELGWQPRLSLETSLRTSFDWYKAYFSGTAVLNHESLIREFFS